MMSLRLSAIFAGLGLLASVLAACDTSDEDGPDAQVGERDAAVDAARDASVSADGAPVAIECTVVPPSDCPDPTLLHYTDVEPIIRERCVSCHDGKGEQWALTRYMDVADWFDQIRSMLSDCSMPPAAAGSAMTNAEREKILAWLKCGFPK